MRGRGWESGTHRRWTWSLRRGRPRRPSCVRGGLSDEQGPRCRLRASYFKRIQVRWIDTLRGDQGCFVVLAGCDAALGVADSLRTSTPLQVGAYPSGRPWLIGRWAASDLVLAQAGHRQVAVLGCCPVAATVLSAAASRARAP